MTLAEKLTDKQCLNVKWTSKAKKRSLRHGFLLVRRVNVIWRRGCCCCWKGCKCVLVCVIAMRQPLKGRQTATDRPETFLIAITHHNGKELCFNWARRDGVQETGSVLFLFHCLGAKDSGWVEQAETGKRFSSTKQKRLTDWLGSATTTTMTASHN